MIKGELACRAEGLLAGRTPFVLATVVRTQHPTSVRAGDVALVLADGTIEGFVGGVCAAASVRLHALRVLETGEPLLLRLEPGGAEGEADTDAADKVVERNPCLSGGSLEIFLEPQLPALRVVIVGESPTARALEQLARAADYEVVRGAADKVRQRSGDAAVIVASHGSEEERALSAALADGVPYVALVASKARGAAVRAALDVPDELRAQLHTPAGLDIGARTPMEIAISILADLVAKRHVSPVRPAPVGSTTDPVCGMEVVPGESTPHLDTVAGRVSFCSERCRDAYAEQHADDLAAR